MEPMAFVAWINPAFAGTRVSACRNHVGHGSTPAFAGTTGNEDNPDETYYDLPSLTRGPVTVGLFTHSFWWDLPPLTRGSGSDLLYCCCYSQIHPRICGDNTKRQACSNFGIHPACAGIRPRIYYTPKVCFSVTE